MKKTIFGSADFGPNSYAGRRQITKSIFLIAGRTISKFWYTYAPPERVRVAEPFQPEPWMDLHALGGGGPGVA